eukprot:gene50943-23611_t
MGMGSAAGALSRALRDARSFGTPESRPVRRGRAAPAMTARGEAAHATATPPTPAASTTPRRWRAARRSDATAAADGVRAVFERRPRRVRLGAGEVSCANPHHTAPDDDDDGEGGGGSDGGF